MTGQGQLTANEVALQLARLGRELDDLVSRLEGAERQMVTAREDYTMAHARAFLHAEGSMEHRKQWAIQETHAERLAAETADALVRGLRRQIDAVKVRIDIGRSVGAALRAEASLAGGPS